MTNDEGANETLGEKSSQKEGAMTVHVVEDFSRKEKAPNIVSLAENYLKLPSGTIFAIQAIQKAILTNADSAAFDDIAKKYGETAYKAARGALKNKQTVGLSLPGNPSLGVRSYHPAGYPEFKKGVLDVFVGLVSPSPLLRADDPWFYLLDTIDGVKIKDAKSANGLAALSTKGQELLKKKFKGIDLLLSEFKKKTPTMLVTAEYLEAAFGEVADLKKFREDLTTIARSLFENPDKIGATNIEAFLQKIPKNAKDFNTFTLKFKAKEYEWLMNFDLIEDGRKYRIGEITNFFCVFGEEELKSAAKVVKDLELNPDNFPYRLLGSQENTHKLFFKPGRFNGPEALPWKNASFAEKHLKLRDLGGSALSGGLEAIKAYQKGASAISVGAVFATHAFVDWASSQAVGKALESLLTKSIATGFAKKLSLHAIKIVPVIGWAFAIYDTGKDVYEIIKTEYHKDSQKWLDDCKKEVQYLRPLLFRTKRGMDHESGITYSKVEIPLVGRQRAPNFDLEARYATYIMKKSDTLEERYALAPLSIRMTQNDGTYFEYGFEFLTKGESLPPFCPFLPDYEPGTEELLKEEKRLDDSLKKLEHEIDEAGWLFDDNESNIKYAIYEVQMCKCRIAKILNPMCTTWLSFRWKKPDKNWAYQYMWIDCKDNAYSADLIDGEISNVEYSQMARELVSQIKVKFKW